MALFGYGVSSSGIQRVAWFETRGVAALLTMRAGGPHPEERPLGRVSKDEATDLQNICRREMQRRAITAAAQRRDHFIEHLSWKRSWSSLTMVATVFSESAPSPSFTTSCR